LSLGLSGTPRGSGIVDASDDDAAADDDDKQLQNLPHKEAACHNPTA